LEAMPPARTFRRSLAVGSLIALTALALGFGVYRVVEWFKNGTGLPILGLVCSTFGFIGVWRTVLMWGRKSRASDSKVEPRFP